jgi:hypothetical protein
VNSAPAGFCTNFRAYGAPTSSDQPRAKPPIDANRLFSLRRRHLTLSYQPLPQPEFASTP